MAQSAAVHRPAPAIVPSPVHVAAARTVTRVLVPAFLTLVALAMLEVVASGDPLALQLAAVTVLVLTMPGTLIATEAVARFRVGTTIRRMERELRAAGTPST